MRHPEEWMAVRNRKAARQGQASSRRRWSFLRAETLYRLSEYARHVRSIWGLG